SSDLSCSRPGAPEAAPAAADRNVAVTETRSPAEKGWRGENAVPLPAGWALKRPACWPLREPTTLTAPISPGETAGKSMSVPGEASGVPGKGNTSSPCSEKLDALAEERATAGDRKPLAAARTSPPRALTTIATSRIG